MLCTRAQCEHHVGQWVQFRTKYGNHVGLVERITKDSVIVLSPRQHIPTQLASADLSLDEHERLDLALAWWGGFGRGGYPGGYGGGAPGVGGYGRGYSGYAGRGGYGGWGGYGWGRWAVSFLIIYALWGLWLW